MYYFPPLRTGCSRNDFEKSENPRPYLNGALRLGGSGSGRRVKAPKKSLKNSPIN